jgi:hypothetical protein
VKPSLIAHLAAKYKGRHILRWALILACIVLPLTQMLPAQDSKTSKFPDGEPKFTSEQLEDYYLVYKNPDVRYLRTLFDAYLNKTGGAEEERQVLDKWNKEYFRSRFVVLSRDKNTFGGTFITILFQDRPDKVFVAWVYPEGSNQQLTLRALRIADFSDEDIKRIKVRYKTLIEDKTHAM